MGVTSLGYCPICVTSASGLRPPEAHRRVCTWSERGGDSRRREREVEVREEVDMSEVKEILLKPQATGLIRGYGV